MRSSRLSRATFQPPWSLFLLPKEPSAGPWGDGNLTWTAPRAGGRLAAVALAVVALVWSRVIAGVLLGILSAIAVEQILYRLFEQPYADKFVSVTPQLGALLGFASAIGLFAMSIWIYPYPRVALNRFR